MSSTAGDEEGAVNDIGHPGVPGRTKLLAVAVVAVVIIATVAVALQLTMDGDGDDVPRSAWAYEMVQLEEARELGLTGGGVRVGILDTGLDVGHPCMKGVRVAAWLDLVAARSGPYDDMGHGTAMASIIAGRSPLRGGALDVELIVVKVVDRDQSFSDEMVADGVDFCLDPDGDGERSDGADIISMSLGGKFTDIDLLLGTKTQAAVSNALANGVVVVAAAGNDPAEPDVVVPGRFAGVIAVGAVDRHGQLAPFSTRGNASIDRPDPDKKPEVVAPGMDVWTAHLDCQYSRGSGTSHATALTTASLAAALSGSPDMLHDGARGGSVEALSNIKEALMTTARPIEGQATPHDPGAGYGLVQAVDLAEALAG